MEFHEKLQELRKCRGLTQEELAQMLYVSRTAVSKWESGRGYPNIDSLKAISRCFSVSLDDLLSGDTLMSLAEEEEEQRANRIRDLVFGLLDCGSALLLFLPLFGQNENGAARAVSLLSLTAVSPYVKGPFSAVVAFSMAAGSALLALRNCRTAWWRKSKHRLSLGLGAAATVVFTAAQQPYAAVFAFVFLAIKALLLIKRA